MDSYFSVSHISTGIYHITKTAMFAAPLSRAPTLRCSSTQAMALKICPPFCVPSPICPLSSSTPTDIWITLAVIFVSLKPH